jgi:hypothetical protein
VGYDIAFTARYANKSLKLVGDDTPMIVGKAQFVEVLNAIKVDVAKGEFKAQLDAVAKRSQI